METIFWGPSGWLFLHTLTFLYPESPTFDDQTRMNDFIKITAQILPCKYCRVSFTKYYQSLPITKFIGSRATLIDWMYRIHNKVNGKLHRQHLNSSPNPSLEKVKKHYAPIIAYINMLISTENDSENRVRAVVNYICTMGLDFLGSIIFNYQGYYSNCHTTEEATKIVSVYHSFFNQIVPLIAGFIGINRKRRCYPIRTILLRNEGYTKLIKWFYQQNDLIDLDAQFKCYDTYIAFFQKHSVASCNMPSVDKVKSCSNATPTKTLHNVYKVYKKHSIRRSHNHSKKH
jgi:hypothetical protein